MSEQDTTTQPAEAKTDLAGTLEAALKAASESLGTLCGGKIEFGETSTSPGSAEAWPENLAAPLMVTRIDVTGDLSGGAFVAAQTADAHVMRAFMLGEEPPAETSAELNEDELDAYVELCNNVASAVGSALRNALQCQASAAATSPHAAEDTASVLGEIGDDCMTASIAAKIADRDTAIMLAFDAELCRAVEDLLKDLRAVVTEHTIHRDYCPACKKHVEPVVPDAMPKATVGHRAVALTSWLHYGLGLSIGQVRELAFCQFQTHISAGGLVASWQRLAEALEPWYVQIGAEARAAAVLHADETGWRMNGRTWWLWCFANQLTCYYLLDPSRGGPALEKFFAEAFDGVLITDFWAAYNAVNAADKQCCLVHLLRELEKVDLQNDSAEWKAFAKTLRRLIGDGIRLRKREDYTPQRYASRVGRIDQRLMTLARAEYGDADASRLGKRLLRHADQLFTFLDYPDVPFENNFAERQIGRR